MIRRVLALAGGSRRDQAASILADAEASGDPVVVAGDFNHRPVWAILG